MTMIAEGAEAKRVEDAVEKRKRKVEDDKRWEGASWPLPVSSTAQLTVFLTKIQGRTVSPTGGASRRAARRRSPRSKSWVEPPRVADLPPKL